MNLFLILIVAFAMAGEPIINDAHTVDGQTDISFSDDNAVYSVNGQPHMGAVENREYVNCWFRWCDVQFNQDGFYYYGSMR